MAIETNRGVRLPLQKEQSAGRGIAELADVPRVYLPLSYMQQESALLLSGYETVLRGQRITIPAHLDGAPVSATVSGVFTGRQLVQHPVYGEVECVVIDGLSSAVEPPGKRNRLDNLTAGAVIDIARRAAIVDEIDGRFLYQKLMELRAHPCSMLVADGVENQPYATSAWAVLRESARRVELGLQLAAHACDVSQVEIAVCLPAARRRVLRTALVSAPLYQTGYRYPVRRYASRKQGPRVGRIGVQACLGLYRAAAFDEPYISGVVTVAGSAVETPQNIRIPFGVPLEAVLSACGLKKTPAHLVFGDMMTGVGVGTDAMPILAGTTCVLALTERQETWERACMGCGRCVRACHRGLMPFKIMRKMGNMQYERIDPLFPGDCDGCGVCTYVCPSGINLTARVLEAKEASGTVFMQGGDEDEL